MGELHALTPPFATFHMFNACTNISPAGACILSVQLLSFQVSLGGLSHALTPLAAASPLIHVFDEPASFLGALWLPYRRDHADVQAAIDAAGPVDAVFGHADVVRIRL